MRGYDFVADVFTGKKEKQLKRSGMKMRKNLDLYIIAIFGLIYIIVFKYLPMYGIVIAFQDFNIFDGILKSEWVGLENFKKLFLDPEFYSVFRNTVLISLYKIAILFPLPVIVAVLLNEVKNADFQKTVQTVIYLPHFLSWIVVAGIMTNMFSSAGYINQLISALGFEKISFMMSNRWFRSVLVFSSGWKETGWSAIIYIAAIAGVDQELYEAAKIDGAGRLNRIIHVTLPGIASTVILMFVLRIGSILEVGTEQVLTMYNPTVYETGDVIGTFVYRMGLGKLMYSYTTAVGLFNSAVGFILVIIGNSLSKRITEKSIW